jgi:hypothetical protein
MADGLKSVGKESAFIDIHVLRNMIHHTTSVEIERIGEGMDLVCCDTLYTNKPQLLPGFKPEASFTHIQCVIK